jgi:bacillolysin
MLDVKVFRISKAILLLLLLLLLLLFSQVVVSSADQVNLHVTSGSPYLQLMDETNGGVRISYHEGTGMVRFIGTSRDHPIEKSIGILSGSTPVNVARIFMEIYGPLFGLGDSAQNQLSLRSEKHGEGNTVIRFQQLYRNVPVLGGEIILYMDENSNLIAAIGELLPELTLDTSPRISADSARKLARLMMVRWYGYPPDELMTSTPELWIYNPILLGGLGPRLNRLVWLVEVQPIGIQPLRELVLIDAHLGVISLHFNQIDYGLFREVYDNENDPNAGLPGIGPVRSESDPATGDIDTDAAYIYTGHAYDFYYDIHGRDSIDDSGGSLISTVRYCPQWGDAEMCPFANAFWNGSQMVFGDGFSQADDIVAHELTHGVTDHESNLFPYMQSGAIDEAFSDIWGEFVDQTNGMGNDSQEARWLIGEDLPILGALRDMSNPPLSGDSDGFPDPDRMGSLLYMCNPADSGGIHTNNGVANKAAFLMVDGGDFNGQTIEGLGITKTAKIWYEVQTSLLTSASDYQDLHDALQQACINLIGTSGITSYDCQQVSYAVDATEMYLQPSACAAPEAPLCPSGQSPIDIFYDDYEDIASGNWFHDAMIGGDGWYYPQNSHMFPGFDATYATSGQFNLWGYDQPSISDSYMAMTFDLDLTAGAYLHFNHAYAFDAEGFSLGDGGIVEYSVDQGNTWSDAGSLFSHNGYNGPIPSPSSNPLAGRNAFGGESNGYISSRIDLGTLAGESVRFRFRIGSDHWGGKFGWFIDDFRIYTCVGTSLENNLYLPLISN